MRVALSLEHVITDNGINMPRHAGLMSVLLYVRKIVQLVDHNKRIYWCYEPIRAEGFYIRNLDFF